MKVLCLDLSLHCGYAVFESADKLTKYGTLHYEGDSVKTRNNYPQSYLGVVAEHIQNVMELVTEEGPDVIVIEETNKGKNRYSQKMLEFLHHRLLEQINFLQFRSDMSGKKFKKLPPDVIYLDTSHWRSVLGIWLTKEQKKTNAKINKAKREGGDSGAREMKKRLGVRGKTNKKHAAIAKANEMFGLNLKVKNNDAADAIMLGAAYFKGATPSNGVSK